MLVTSPIIRSLIIICTHPYYRFKELNTYKYELMFDVERMIHLKTDYTWEDLQASVGKETEKKILPADFNY